MTLFTSLPPEILTLIVAHFSHDGDTLKNLSMTSRWLTPIGQYHLFSSVDFEILDHLEAEPFRGYITHLKLSPRSEVLAAYPDPPIKAALNLPRLRGLCFSRLSFQHMSFPAAVQTHLHAFTAVVELSLYETKHPDREHIQEMLCALPNLSRLSLRAVTLLKNSSGVGKYFTRNRPEPAPEASAPRLTYLRASPAYAMDGTMAIVEWLPRTPTKDTLLVLELPADSQNAEVVTSSDFGSSVESLTIGRLESISRSWDVSFISRYVALRTLDVGWDPSGPQRWYQLYKMLYSVQSPNLCEVILRFDATEDPDSLMDLDTFLAFPVDSYLSRSFLRLDRVCIIIRCDARTLPATKREQLRKEVKRWMPKLHACGKLQIEFDYVGTVPTTHY